MERLMILSSGFHVFPGHYFEQRHVVEGELGSWQINTRKIYLDRFFFLFWFCRKEPKGIGIVVVLLHL